MSTLLIAAGILVCLAVSAFFSSAEMTYSSCNTLRLENARDDGSKKAASALKITEKFDDALSAILIGNNLANIGGSSLASVLVIALLGEGYAWAATAVMTILVIIFGETIPKIKAKKNANTLALRYAGIVRFVTVLLMPLIRLTVLLLHLISNKIPDENDDDENDEAVEELQSIIETAEDEDVIDEEQSELVRAAIDFSEVSASEVMTARVDVIAIDVDSSPEDIRAIVEEARYSRIPVYEGSIDNIIGILYINRYLKALTDGSGTAGIRSLLMPARFIYKTMKLPTVLERLKKAKQHLAIVTDEYGGTLGVISMEDVLEELVGEIWDEDDVFDPEIVESSDGEYVLDGDMPISDFFELAGIDADEANAESETLGGWIVEKLERFPLAGDGFDEERFSVKVLKIDGRRVEKAKLILHTPEEPEE